MQEWEKFEAELASSNFSPAKKKLMERINYYGHTTEMDTQGRLLVPQLIREELNVTGDNGCFGMQTYFYEIANREIQANMDANPMTAEDEESLAGFGL